jgi:hypothetical protein
MSASDLLDFMRPFIWLALAAFLAGFFSYIVLGESHAAAKAPTPAAVVYAPVASAPSSNDWNLPKRI